MPATTERFASVVRDKLVENKLVGRKPDSIRSLARAMAKGDPTRAETYKRSLFKWMAPGEPRPTRASRALVAEALELNAGELDDEEADPVADLFSALTRVVDQRIAKAKAA